MHVETRLWLWAAPWRHHVWQAFSRFPAPSHKGKPPAGASFVKPDLLMHLSATPFRAQSSGWWKSMKYWGLLIRISHYSDNTTTSHCYIFEPFTLTIWSLKLKQGDQGWWYSWGERCIPITTVIYRSSHSCVQLVLVMLPALVVVSTINQPLVNHWLTIWFDHFRFISGKWTHSIIVSDIY